jgi:phosphate transport system ATP-binding protein
MKNNILEIKDFSFYYGKKLAVENITLNIKEKVITAIIGSSGCGKSTFLRSINRMNELIHGTSHTGDILFHKDSIYAPVIDVVSLRKKIGMVFQKPNPFPMTITENVQYGLKVHGLKDKKKLQELTEVYLKKVFLWDEVKDKLKQSALSLSGGQQQRLCIARSLAINPEILLMDEPCSALDPIATLKIEDLMSDLSKDITIIIVTHNMQQAARVSDFTAFFNTDETRVGKLVEYSETSKLFTTPKNKETTDYITGRFG